MNSTPQDTQQAQAAPRILIRNRWTGDTIREVEGESLRSANLTGANLYGADLSRANLTGANLYGADLSRANLTGANLYGADLSRANLTGANLSRANLTGANLYGADLSRANLTGADLSRANLSRANLSRANLSRLKFINWESHTLISALLMREASDNIPRRMIAGLILVSTDWCWDRFLVIDHPEREWALRVLAPLVKDDDNACTLWRRIAKLIVVGESVPAAAETFP